MMHDVSIIHSKEGHIPAGKNNFTQKDISVLLGINPETIALYAKKRLVVPDIFDPKGRGTTRIYSRFNLFEFLVLKELAKNGMTHAKIKKIIECLRKQRKKSSLSDYAEIEARGDFGWGEAMLRDQSMQKERVYISIFNPHSDNISASHFSGPDYRDEQGGDIIRIAMGSEEHNRINAILVVDVTDIRQLIIDI